MTTYDKPFRSLEALCLAAIEQRVDFDFSPPQELLDKVFRLYKDFFSAYLNFVRQKEHKPMDWMPNEVAVDAELADHMRHFFSDYQHIVKRYNRINSELAALKKIDRRRQPQVYDLAVDAILKAETVSTNEDREGLCSAKGGT